MAELRAIRNHIIFQFEDEKTQHMGISQFKESTDWGFEYALTTEGMENARWVRVIAVGPDADPDVQPGMRVLLDKLKWTTEFEFEGAKYWRSDTDQVLLLDPAEG